MPANLPPHYFEAEKRYRLAKDPEDKIAALQAMLAIMPKHKGTDKLHAELRRKIARLSDEAERKYATARRAGFYIGREGAGQVILVGLANVGKSHLLASVTEACPEIAPYPYTTKTAIPGMMKFEDIQIQLVDTPPIGDKHVRTLLANSLRGADLIAIVVDLGGEPVGQVEATLQALREARIEHLSDRPEEAIPGSYQKKMLIIGNKSDLDGSGREWGELVSQYGGWLPMVCTSAKEGNGLDRMRESIYKALDIVRVYTKSPGSKADLTEPVILKRGSTAMDAAESVHKDFQQYLKYVVVWGSGKYDGQRVSREHALQDRDIVEFHV